MRRREQVSAPAEHEVRRYEWAAGVLIRSATQALAPGMDARARAVLRQCRRRGFDPLDIGRGAMSDADRTLLAALPGTAGQVARALGLRSGQDARRLLEDAQARGLVTRQPVEHRAPSIWKEAE